MSFGANWLGIGCFGVVMLSCSGTLSALETAPSEGEIPQNDGGSSPQLDAGVLDAGVTEEKDAGAACVGCGLCAGATGVPTAFEQTLLDLPPQSWFEAPNSKMRPVCVPDSLGVRLIVGCTAVIGAWSSGAFDSIRRRMMVWGGGHADYGGNELYGFDLRTGTWSRVTEPSLVPAGTMPANFFNRDPLPDGQPVSRHTYGGIQFLEHLGLLWAHGGSQATNGNGTNRTWMFDADGGWSQRAPGVGGYCLATSYDAPSGQMMVYSSEYLHIYNVNTDTWKTVPGFGYASTGLWPRYGFSGDKTGVVDPRRRLFWVMGGTGRRSPNEPPLGGHGNVMVWDVVAQRAVTNEWITTGGGDFSNASFISSTYAGQRFESGGGDVYNVMAPGVDYDPTTDSFVAWPNWGPPYILDLATKVWTKGSAVGAPPITRASNSGGTYGRWRYLAMYNVFVLVNSVDQNVFFYKHSAGCGPQ